MLILNIMVLAALIGLHWYLSSTKGWFQHRHIRLSQTAWFAITIGTFWVPITPLLIDSMIFASILYIGAEWVYQRYQWSPITELVGQTEEADKSEDAA